MILILVNPFFWGASGRERVDLRMIINFMEAWPTKFAPA